jgi:hypothetical protein
LEVVSLEVVSLEVVSFDVVDLRAYGFASTFLAVVALIFFLSLPIAAQAVPENPASAETSNRVPGMQAAAGPEAVSNAFFATPPGGRPHRVIDKKFIFAMGALGATESMRFTTRQLVLEHEKSAGAPWVTSVPSHTHLVFKYAPIFAAELAVAYELKKPHDWLPADRVIRKLWWVYPVAMGSIHLHNAICNIRTQAPAACPVAECQM